MVGRKRVRHGHDGTFHDWKGTQLREQLEDLPFWKEGKKRKRKRRDCVDVEVCTSCAQKCVNGEGVHAAKLGVDRRRHSPAFRRGRQLGFTSRVSVTHL